MPTYNVSASSAINSNKKVAWTQVLAGINALEVLGGRRYRVPQIGGGGGSRPTTGQLFPRGMK